MIARRRLLASLTGLPLLAACGRSGLSAVPTIAPASLPPTATPPSTPGPVGLRQLRIGQPNVEPYAGWSYRFGNMNSYLDPERKVRLSVQGLDVGLVADPLDFPLNYTLALAQSPVADVPDLAMIGPEEGSVLPTMAAAGALHDLTPILKAEKWFSTDDFRGNVLDAGRAQGKLLAIPIAVSAEVLVYHSRRFADANVPTPPPSWTWDELVRTARQLTAPATGGSARWGFFVGRGSPTLFSLAWQHGAELTAPGGTELKLDEPGTRRAVDLLLDLLHRHKVASVLDNGGPLLGQIDNALASGRAAMASFMAGGNQSASPQSQGEVRTAEMPIAEKRVVFGTAPLMLGIPTRAPDVAHSVNGLRAILETGLAYAQMSPTTKPGKLAGKSWDGPAIASTLEMARFVPADSPLRFRSAIEREFLLPILKGDKSFDDAARDARLVVEGMARREADAAARLSTPRGG